jgi:hypothetical protein
MRTASPLPPPPLPRRVSPEAARAARLQVALQEGVGVPGLLPCPIVAFLVEQLGLEPSYVERRISTFFLDGEVVDDPERALVRDGSILALSAALPGLVGATLRKGGYYSTMRAGITHHARASVEPVAPGVVQLKLFNLIIAELAPALLAHGLLLDAPRAAALLAELGQPPAPADAVVLLTALPQGAP